MQKIDKKIVGYAVATGETAPAAPLKRERPERLPGFTYRVKTGEMPHAMYVTITDHMNENGKAEPFEVFINTKDVAASQWTIALTRLVSAMFRAGIPHDFVIKELRSVFDPAGGVWYKRRLRPSLVAVIGEVIAEHCAPNGPGEMPAKTEISGARECPKCHEIALVKKDGCDTCIACGSSKCG